MNDPGPKHFEALHHFCRYISSHKDLGIEFTWTPSKTNDRLVGYTDSSHNDDLDSSHSTISYVFKYNDSFISAFSKVGPQNMPDASVNHSELEAFMEGTREAMWLGELEQEILRTKLKAPTVPIFVTKDKPGHKTGIPIHVDNTGVKAVMENPIHHHANKFIRERINSTKEAVAHGIVSIHRVTTDLNIADIGTKQNGRERSAWLTQHFVKTPRFFPGS